MEKIDPNIFTEAKNTSAMADGGCGTCQRNGMPFFLVRQSVINPNAYHGIDWSENVPKLADRRPNVALTKHKYALRMLRKGYVYVLMEQNGIRKLLGYEVTSKGALRHRSIYHMKKYEIEDLAEKCTEKNHNIPAIFANIDVLNATVWIAYSRRAWSKDIEDYYRSPDADLRRFTQVTINDKTRNNPTDLTDGRSFAFNDLLDKNKAPYLPEFFFDKKDFNVRFPSAHEFYDYSDKDNLNAIANIAAKFEKQYQCTIGCIVLEDTFGIAEELNAQRFRNFDPINNAFLEHEREIEKKLTDAYNEKIADYTPSDNWLNASDELPQLFPYAKDYFQSLINPNIDDNQSDTAQSQAITVPLRPNTDTSKYYHKYFSTERGYKRRIVSCIDAYKKGLKNYCNEVIDKDYEGADTQPKYYDAYEPGSNYKGAKNSYYNTIKTLQENGYKEVALSEAEKKELLTKHKSAIPAVDVRRFHWTLDNAAESKFKKEWAKLDARLDKGKLGAFRQEEKQLFDEIVKDIRKISIDYLVYVTWLFGSKDKPSKYAPAGLTNYNQVEFWKREQENDYSKDHLGYFEDITTILQGNITMAKLPEQFGLWDSLLRDENSIYFHLLKGQDNNLYEWLLKQRTDEMEQNQDAANHKTNVTILNELVGKINDILNLPIDAKNTTLFVDKMEVLMNWMAAGAANPPKNAKLINDVLMKDHGTELLKMFSGIENRRISLPVKIKNLPKVYEILMDHSDVSTVSIDKNSKLYKLSRVSDADKRWQFESQLTKKQLEKTVQMEFMVVADDIASMNNMIDELKKGGNLKETTLAKAKKVLDAEIKHAHQFSGELTLADLEIAMVQAKRRIKFDASKGILMNGIMIFLQGHLFSQNRQALEAAGRDMRQDVKEEILNDMAKTGVIMSLMSAEVMAHTIKLVGSVLPKTNIFTTMIPGCEKFIKVTGGTLALITILNGVMDIYKGYCYAKNGDSDDGELIIWGGILSSLSGGITLYGAIFSLTLSVAILAIAIAIIGVILVYIGSEADRWSPLQIWFNRCYFGKHEHQEKGGPYPLTAVGTSAALNDYFAYLSGVYLALNYQPYDMEFFLDDIRNDSDENAALIYAGGLHVHIKLPNFDAHSRYTCMVYLTDSEEQSAKVQIVKGKDDKNLNVTVSPNQCNYDLVRWVASKDYPIESNINDTVVIDQKVAELRVKAKKVIGILHYWQGKDAKSPLRIEHIIN
ncbi:toxin VasX [Gilliamella bombi]|uniref:toxin VasX n=1 Tax=Gilliamella bombi TaxID=1908521 RepID=UPI000A1609B6|nr:toxin VasX [Gilliamella bombi]